ncbi:hypothetical protein KFK09_004873 [Dendrobium nobile]|uniref:TOG domain-containing protein n=1 Tax=Dendrobium nobile TaxID=94219 RepID=A0A8T3BU56_DENNO|nr:hypothetical protein KFK09_004873 [Dendrobium nobile]
MQGRKSSSRPASSPCFRLKCLNFRSYRRSRRTATEVPRKKRRREKVNFAASSHGGIHKRYASPLLRDRGLQPSRVPSHAVTMNVPGFATSAIVAMDRSSSVTSGMSLSTVTPALSRMKLREKGFERSLEIMLQASKQKVLAIERLLRGASLSDKQINSSTQSTSLDLGVDSPSSRDPPVPAAIPGSNHLSLHESLLADPTFVSIATSSTRNGSSSLTEVINSNNQYVGGHSKYDNLASDSLHAERALDGSTVERNIDLSFKKLSNMHLDRQSMDAANKDAGFRDLNNNYVPNFQRPLLRKQATGRVSASRRRIFDDNQSHLVELSSYVDGPTSLGDALSEGFCSSSDWVARVSAFNYLRNLLQQGPRGIQEVTQNFEKVMKLFFRHMHDPHHKVAQAALSTLVVIIPPCRKPFESYLERILPYVFSSRTYGIDSLLPVLLRSLDEQRSPKAKLAVVEFVNNSFDNHSPNSDGYSNGGILKFLSIEEQNLLRRALKQFTPRIDVDLVNVLQSKKVLGPHSKDLRHGTDPDSLMDYESSMGNQQLEITQMIGSDGFKDIGPTFGGERLHDTELFLEKATSSINAEAESELSILQILHHICSISGEKSGRSKHEALYKLVGASIANDNSVWAKKKRGAKQPTSTSNQTNQLSNDGKASNDHGKLCIELGRPLISINYIQGKLLFFEPLSLKSGRLLFFSVPGLFPENVTLWFRGLLVSRECFFVFS